MRNRKIKTEAQTQASVICYGNIEARNCGNSGDEIYRPTNNVPIVGFYG